MSKIRSYTLFELVLAMILAGIVVGMAYTAFRLFTKIYGNYEHKTTAIAQIQMLRSVLYKDVERGSSVSVADSEITICDIHDSSCLKYLAGQDQLIRASGNVKDTFHMKNLVLHTEFEERAVSAGIVDHLLLKFDFESSSMMITVRKKYTAQDLLINTDTLWKP